MAINKPEKSVVDSIPLKLISTRLAPALLIFVSLSLLVFHRVENVSVGKIQMTVADFFAPTLEVITKPLSVAMNSIEGVQSVRAIKAENIRLVQENARLKEWYEKALILQAENKSFRDLLNVRADPALVFVTARVVADSGGSFVKSILIPVGTDDHVRQGSAVMSGKGLIGRVTTVGEKSSRVLLINDLNSRIPIMVQGTRTRAILAGKNDGEMKLERLPIDSGLTVGERIVTSGDGGQLPAEVPIGVITKVNTEGVFVKPLSDVDRADYVQVIDAGADDILLDPATSSSPLEDKP